VKLTSKTKAKWNQNQKPKAKKKQVGTQMGDSSSKMHAKHRFKLQNAANSKESCPRLKKKNKAKKKQKIYIPSFHNYPYLTIVGSTLFSPRSETLMAHCRNIFIPWESRKVNLFRMEGVPGTHLAMTHQRSPNVTKGRQGHPGNS
jgi:hypothetical protein